MVNQAYKSEGNVWTGKFDLNSDTCGRGNFFNPEKKVAHSKISGYMWTAPYFPVSDKHIENMRLSMI